MFTTQDKNNSLKTILSILLLIAVTTLTTTITIVIINLPICIEPQNLVRSQPCMLDTLDT